MPGIDGPFELTLSFNLYKPQNITPFILKIRKVMLIEFKNLH